MKYALCAIAVGLLAPLTWAQDDLWEDVSPWETDISGEATLVLNPAVAAEGERALFLLAGSTKTSYVFENGLIMGAAGRVEIQKDHPSRAGFSGNIGSGHDLPVGQGAFSGLSAVANPEKIGPRGQLEEAYIWFSGGYGEVRIGRDDGIAARFYEGAPTTLMFAPIVNASLDPTGRNFIQTRHDLTGPAAKITATSPRILGVRAGFSYTPEADVRGLDRDPTRSLSDGGQLDLQNAVEIAANVTRRLPDGGPRIQANLAWSQADLSRLSEETSVETLSTGASIEGEKWEIGVSFLASDNGFDRTSGDYTAWHVGAARNWKAWKIGIGYGEATDDGASLESDAWDIAVAKYIEDADVSLSAGYRMQSVSHDLFAPGNSPEKIDSLVIEITQTF